MQSNPAVTSRFTPKGWAVAQAPASSPMRPLAQTLRSRRRHSGTEVFSGNSSRAGPAIARENSDNSLKIQGARRYCAQITGSVVTTVRQSHAPAAAADLIYLNVCVFQKGYSKGILLICIPIMGVHAGGLPYVCRILRILPFRANPPIRHFRPRRRRTPSSTDIANANASRSSHGAGPIVGPGRDAAGNAFFQPQPGEL